MHRRQQGRKFVDLQHPMGANHEANGPSGKPRVLRVLLVEDSQADADLLLRALERGGFAPEWERVDTRKNMTAALSRRPLDLILADHSLPSFNAVEALQVARISGLDIPFIIVSGWIDEETAVAAMRAGAKDYVMKERLARLAPVVERELREAEVRRLRRRSEEELRRAHEELETRVEERTADLKSANLKLQNVIEQRKRLETELLDIAENERRRIGFDLHDDLGQKLTGASLMLKGLEQKLSSQQHGCATDARKIHCLIEELIHHTHDLAHEFSSLDVSGNDLPCVLRELAGNVKKMFHLPCSFAVKGTIPCLPANAALQLHKIAQEALSNAIKHGKARNLAIRLLKETGQIVMTIKNDGLPFSPPANSRGRMGLRIMNYRASTIGGTLQIRASEPSGTLVTCCLPTANGKASRPSSGRKRRPHVASRKKR
jgi:signal transduction histidine kinase